MATKKLTEKQRLQKKADKLNIKYQPNDTIDMLKAAISGKEAEVKLSGTSKLDKVKELAKGAKVTVIEPSDSDVIREAGEKLKKKADGDLKFELETKDSGEPHGNITLPEKAAKINAMLIQENGKHDTAGFRQKINLMYPELTIQDVSANPHQAAFTVSDGKTDSRCPHAGYVSTNF